MVVLRDRRVHPRMALAAPYIVVAWLPWLLLLSILVWAANKSIAMNDEGALLLGYKYPALVSAESGG